MLIAGAVAAGLLVLLVLAQLFLPASRRTSCVPSSSATGAWTACTWRPSPR